MADLEAVINQSIENASVAGDEGGDGGSDVVDDAPETDSGDTEDAIGSDDADAGADADGNIDAAAEEAAARTDRRTPARIRWKQHEKLVQKATAQLQQDLQARDARLQALAWAEQQGAQDAVKALHLADTDPDRFFGALLTDGRYAALLEARVKAALAEHQPKQAPATAAPSARPKPDVLNADGSVGYSEEGFQAALAYERAEAVKEALAEMRREQDEKFGPIIKDREERAKYDASLSKMGKALNEAREEWPQFKEHEAEIKSWLNAQWKTPGGSRKTLLHGWQAVVFPKLQVNRDTMRKELLDEINSKKAAAIKPPTSGSPKAAPSGPRDLTDVINEAVNASGLK